LQGIRSAVIEFADAGNSAKLKFTSAY